MWSKGKYKATVIKNMNMGEKEDPLTKGMGLNPKKNLQI